MKKLVFISNMAAPYQIKKCYELNKFMDAEFWFYTYLEANRPNWWKIPLGDKCKILNNVFSFKQKYFTFDVIKELNRFEPDVVMLGGFSIPSNYLAYLWARKHHKKVIVFSEVSRDKSGRVRGDGLIWKILRKLYKDIDAVFTTSNVEARKQFTSFFPHKSVFSTTYGADIDENLKHPTKKTEGEMVLLYANRLIDIYDPLLAIDIFYELSKKYDFITLKMNSSGVLKEQCLKKIKDYSLESRVKFLDDIKSWDDLNLVYKSSDVLYLPASFSNGNLSIMEAMASGMGIVISDKVNGHGHILKDNENCFICSYDRDEFIKRLELYINNRQLINRHGAISRDNVKYLSLSNTAKNYYEEFKRLGLIDD